MASELGWLFWSDWNEKDTKVERSNLDGSERVFIVHDNLGWPNGITLGKSVHIHHSSISLIELICFRFD